MGLPVFVSGRRVPSIFGGNQSHYENVVIRKSGQTSYHAKNLYIQLFHAGKLPIYKFHSIYVCVYPLWLIIHILQAVDQWYNLLYHTMMGETVLPQTPEQFAYSFQCIYPKPSVIYGRTRRHLAEDLIELLFLFCLRTTSGRESHEDLEGVVDHPLETGLVTMVSK